MPSVIEHPLVVLGTVGLCPTDHKLVQGFVGSRINGLARKSVNHEAVVHQPYLIVQVTEGGRVRIGTADDAHIFRSEVFQCGLAVRMDRDADAETCQMDAS